ncbi:formate/nitrite transporter family protein [Clostridium tagluense]|nr:formate/nitrite transporter family protein [Clostridium tagluense]WLC66422.1 formate/nitrite transporter family protein [Clostridium tagluense]
MPSRLELIYCFYQVTVTLVGQEVDHLLWMAYGSKDLGGEIFAIFFPIWLFITSGFEHSVANMYYIPAGIMAKGNKALVDAAAVLGVTPEKLNHLNWETFFIKNLIPVTLGNIVGGGIFVSAVYWYVYSRSSKDFEKKVNVEETSNVA